MPQSNLIVFATYWNEIDWIRASLDQIDRIDPVEAIICDGCYDPRVPNESTDGTREIIQEYVAERPNSRMISAVRVSRMRGFLDLLRGHDRARWWQIFTPARLKTLVLWGHCVDYRVNQALTFQRMIGLSRKWKAGRWFMTYDSDQFYDDDMIEQFRRIDQITDADLLTGSERTFFDSFDAYTDEYEARQFNNMPHRILPGTSIAPTRSLIVEDFSRRSFRVKNAMRNELYFFKVPHRQTGHYFHYKFKLDHGRYESGYQLGDRKRPNAADYPQSKFCGRHPSVIEAHFSPDND